MRSSATGPPHWTGLCARLGLGLCFLASGCVSAATYRAKVDELARLREESSRRDTRLHQDLVRLETRLGQVQGEIGELNQRTAQAVQAEAHLAGRVEALGQSVAAIERKLAAPPPSPAAPGPVRQPNARELRDPFGPRRSGF